MINPRVPNMMQMWGTAGGAFAERTRALDPTIEEAHEEYARADAFEKKALVLGIALGLATFTLVASKLPKGK